MLYEVITVKVGEQPDAGKWRAAADDERRHARRQRGRLTLSLSLSLSLSFPLSILFLLLV